MAAAAAELQLLGTKDSGEKPRGKLASFKKRSEQLEFYSWPQAAIPSEKNDLK